MRILYLNDEMKDWEQLKIILDEQNIKGEDRRLIRAFLGFFSFSERQRLLGIFIGFSDKIYLFVDLLRKKRDLAKSGNDNLAAEIFNMEDKLINNLIEDLK